MSTLLGHRDLLPAPPARPDPGDGPRGFVDCRGVLHLWDEEDD